MNINRDELKKYFEAKCNAKKSKQDPLLPKQETQEDWEGGGSRPFDEGQKFTRDEDKQVENFQSIPTQNTHELDAEEEIAPKKNSKRGLDHGEEEYKQRRTA